MYLIKKQLTAKTHFRYNFLCIKQERQIRHDHETFKIKKNQNKIELYDDDLTL